MILYNDILTFINLQPILGLPDIAKKTTFSDNLTDIVRL